MVKIINLESPASRVESAEEKIAALLSEHDEMLVAYERADGFRREAEEEGDLHKQLHFAEFALRALKRSGEALDEANALAAAALDSNWN